MTKIRRGGYIFVTWIGDHPPKHVHVFKDGTLIVKFDLEKEIEIKGKASNKIKVLIKQLISDGLL